MRKETIEFKLAFLILTLLFFSTGITAQTIFDQDSLIRIQKIKIFPVSNPVPKYIVEIRNDRTISFYNILPENFSKDHPGFIGWFVDSTTINIENSDFIDLEKTINGIDLENIIKLEKPNSENGIEMHISGGVSDKYIIELMNQKIESSIDPNNEKYISESLKKIRNIIGDLENKYKPER